MYDISCVCVCVCVHGWCAGVRGGLQDAIAREARHGYFAAVSFADDLVGKALTALDGTGKANDTVVLLTADHGWQLGEHNEVKTAVQSVHAWCNHV
jgi:arylsulfatase A-like enzyme